MNLNITQQNVHLLLPSKLSWMANMLAEDKGMKRFFENESPVAVPFGKAKFPQKLTVCVPKGSRRKK